MVGTFIKGDIAPLFKLFKGGYYLKVLGRMHCMLMDLLHGFEVLSTTEETLFNSRNVSRLVQNNLIADNLSITDIALKN